MSTSTSRQVVINEVGLRDGLQSIATILTTQQKREWVLEAYQAGIRELEAGSFVPPKLLPQLADTAELVAYAKTLPGLFVSVLVPNLKGAERAIDSGADLMVLPISASYEHSLANVRKTPDEMLVELERIQAAKQAAGASTIIEAGIGTAFGCSIQGHVDSSEVLRLSQSALEAGADRISLADTVGYADPRKVSELFSQVIALVGDPCWRAHFHDTRGLALANVCAALDAGITRFDASLAGIGGCPNSPGASGNVATEDLTFMLSSMRHEIDIDITKLLELREKIAKWLSSEETYGTLWRAGLPKTFEANDLRING